MSKITINLINNTLFISGDIDFDNLENVLNECIRKTDKINLINVDMKGLRKPNSSVLIFIINYIRNSIKNNQKIKFINIPVLLSELSKVYNLKSIIDR